MEKTCKHCGKSFDLSSRSKGWMANHSRWCTSNPKRKDYEAALIRSRSFIVNDVLKARNDSIKKAWQNGAYDFVDFGSANTGKKHSLETKSILREKALRSPHRRLKRGIVEYKGVLLDSSWELELAKRLDFLGIKWIRPNPITWKDEKGVQRHYFPDFYLLDYDLYLDPKNPHAFKVQEKKIQILKQTIKNLLFLHNIEEIRNFTVR